MKKRNYLLTTIILLCAFTTANAQFVDDDFDDLLDFGEDEEEIPLHDEYFNQIYVQYSPTRYNFDGATPNLHFNEFAVGYNRAIQIVEKKPFFIEAGLQLKYSTCSGDDDHQNASFKLFTFKLPINVTYKLYIPHSEVAFAPYAGVYFRAGLTGKQSLNSNKTDNSEKSGIGGFLKSALTFIGFIFLWGLSKACGRGLVRGTTASQLGFFIGVMFAGIAGGIIPAFVAYKYCKFDNPSTVVWVIFIAHIIISFLSACLIIPIGSIPIGIIIAILLFCFNHK